MLLENTVLARTGDFTMIKFKYKGNFKKTEKYFKKMGEGDYFEGVKAFAESGVLALSKNTPVDTGKTASSWSYSIVRSKDKLKIIWNNSNVNKGCNVAVLIQYGHGTGDGYYVEGIDYINPSLKPIFNLIAKRVWEEVTKDA